MELGVPSRLPVADRSSQHLGGLIQLAEWLAASLSNSHSASMLGRLIRVFLFLGTALELVGKRKKRHQPF